MLARAACIAVLGSVLTLGTTNALGQARVWVADQGQNDGIHNNRILEIDPLNKKDPPDADGTDIIILNTLPSPAECFLDELDFGADDRLWAVVKDTCDQTIDGAKRIDKETGAIDDPPGLITPEFPGEVNADVYLEGLAWDGTGLWISAVRKNNGGNLLTRVNTVNGAQIAPFTATPLAGGKCNIPGTIAQGLLWESGNNGYGWLWHTDVQVNKIYKLDISRLFTDPSYNPNDPGALTVAEYSVPFQPKGLAWVGCMIWVCSPRNGIYEFNPADGATRKLFNAPNWNLDGLAVWQPPLAQQINLNKSTIAASVWLGDGNPADDTFTVANGCGGTLDYTITDNAAPDDWLNVTPLSGSSTGSANTHTVSYSVSGKPVGRYNATITVTGNAWNSPRTITVTVTIHTVKPDLDGDADVDQQDFGVLQACYTQGGSGPTSTCLDADFNGDSLINSADLSIFLGCLSGPGVEAERDCETSP